MAHMKVAYAPSDLGDRFDDFDVTYDPDRKERTAKGPCPTCGTPTTRTYKITTTTGGRALTAGRAHEDVTMSCECALAHEGRPDDLTGCGAHWKVRLA